MRMELFRIPSSKILVNNMFQVYFSTSVLLLLPGCAAADLGAEDVRNNQLLRPLHVPLPTLDFSIEPFDLLLLLLTKQLILVLLDGVIDLTQVIGEGVLLESLEGIRVINFGDELMPVF